MGHYITDGCFDINYHILPLVINFPLSRNVSGLISQPNLFSVDYFIFIENLFLLKNLILMNNPISKNYF